MTVLTDPSPHRFLGYRTRKLISTLTIMFLVLGVMAEVISLATSAYNFEKTRSEATTACVRALAATCDALHPQSEACQKKC